MIEPVPDLSEYINLTDNELLVMLGKVMTAIAGNHGELAWAEEQELRAKVKGYRDSTASSQSAREWDARVTAHEASITVTELRAKISQKVEEKFYLLRLLDARKFEHNKD